MARYLVGGDPLDSEKNLSWIQYFYEFVLNVLVQDFLRVLIGLAKSLDLIPRILLAIYEDTLEFELTIELRYSDVKIW